ncbi:MAG: retron system putative HNH endonuclease [Acidobacteriota bacterium]
MRRSVRSDLDRPDVLAPENSDAAEETASNIAEVLAADAAVPVRKPALKFKVYKDRDIKVALHRMFHGKCAYCESRYFAATPMDVEHYRPKKEVEKWKGEPKRRGYYWLGADWENLLPSCADCNRRREHFDMETGADGPTLGKRAIFPLLDPSARWERHDQDNDEVPLLLNPCDDAPEQLFQFDELGLVTPKAGISADEKERVEASIEIYGLNRPGLVQERLATLRLLQHKMAVIDRVVEIMDDAAPGGTTHALAEDLLQFLLSDLRAFQEPEQPYSVAARHMTEEFLDGFA